MSSYDHSDKLNSSPTQSCEFIDHDLNIDTDILNFLEHFFSNVENNGVIYDII